MRRISTFLAKLWLATLLTSLAQAQEFETRLQLAGERYARPAAHFFDVTNETVSLSADAGSLRWQFLLQEDGQVTATTRNAEPNFGSTFQLALGEDLIEIVENFSFFGFPGQMTIRRFRADGSLAFEQAIMRPNPSFGQQATSLPQAKPDGQGGFWLAIGGLQHFDAAGNWRTISRNQSRYGVFIGDAAYSVSGNEIYRIPLSRTASLQQTSFLPPSTFAQCLQPAATGLVAIAIRFDSVRQQHVLSRLNLTNAGQLQNSTELLSSANQFSLTICERGRASLVQISNTESEHIMLDAALNLQWRALSARPQSARIGPNGELFALSSTNGSASLTRINYYSALGVRTELSAYLQGFAAAGFNASGALFIANRIATDSGDHLQVTKLIAPNDPRGPQRRYNLSVPAGAPVISQAVIENQLELISHDTDKKRVQHWQISTNGLANITHQRRAILNLADRFAGAWLSASADSEGVSQLELRESTGSVRFTRVALISQLACAINWCDLIGINQFDHSAYQINAAGQLSVSAEVRRFIKALLPAQGRRANAQTYEAILRFFGRQSIVGPAVMNSYSEVTQNEDGSHWFADYTSAGLLDQGGNLQFTRACPESSCTFLLDKNAKRLFVYGQTEAVSTMRELLRSGEWSDGWPIPLMMPSGIAVSGSLIWLRAVEQRANSLSNAQIIYAFDTQTGASQRIELAPSARANLDRTGKPLLLAHARTLLSFDSVVEGNSDVLSVRRTAFSKEAQDFADGFE